MPARLSGGCDPFDGSEWEEEPGGGGRVVSGLRTLCPGLQKRKHETEKHGEKDHHTCHLSSSRGADGHREGDAPGADFRQSGALQSPGYGSYPVSDPETVASQASPGQPATEVGIYGSIAA